MTCVADRRAHASLAIVDTLVITLVCDEQRPRLARCALPLLRVTHITRSVFDFAVIATGRAVGVLVLVARVVPIRRRVVVFGL